MQRLQGLLPLNPQGFGAVSPDSSFNTAISFMTNTNWQGYGGETTMSYLTQMLGLAVQNFLSAAAGMAVLVALIRGFARHTMETIGNFWVDMTRSTVYILLPLATVLALVLVSQGVVQNLSAYQTVPTVETITYDTPKMDAAGNPVKDAAGNPVTEKATTKEQTLPLGPAASQIAIKQLGTNGGGFFNVNSAHPLRESHAILQFRDDAGDPADSCRAVLHLRQHGGRHAPGLGDPRGDDDDCSSASSPWRNTMSCRATPLSRHWAWIRLFPPVRSTSPAATWKARRRASASSIPPCGPRPPRLPPTVR